MLEADFKTRVLADFGIEYRTYKAKLAYDMVIWGDGTDGTVAGAFAGHSHNQRVPHFEYHGWVYALSPSDDKWYLMPDGQSGWRNGENPFPAIEANDFPTW